LCSPCEASAEKPAVDYDDWKQQEIQAGFSEIEAGEGAPNEKVIEWLRSWGSKNELPPPL
jgi:predicted transcriptional regulator